MKNGAIGEIRGQLVNGQIKGPRFEKCIPEQIKWGEARRTCRLSKLVMLELVFTFWETVIRLVGNRRIIIVYYYYYYQFSAVSLGKEFHPCGVSGSA